MRGGSSPGSLRGRARVSGGRGGDRGQRVNCLGEGAQKSREKPALIECPLCAGPSPALAQIVPYPKLRATPEIKAIVYCYGCRQLGKLRRGRVEVLCPPC